MAHSVFIDGAAGTTGLEIRERLAGKAAFDCIALDDDRRKDPAARREALNAADFAILCLPDDAARDAVAMIDPASGTRVIDASSAHRTADGWTYGFPELVGEETVAGADRVSNPGCYPTGFLALVAPLVRAGLLPADWPYTVHAVSGYSGGGKALIDRFEREGDIAFRAYGFGLRHKHLAEMQVHAGLAHAPIFSPAVVPAYRGMLVEVPLHPGAMPGAAEPDAMRAELAGFFDGAARVRVAEDTPDELLLREGADGHDGLELRVFQNPDGKQVRLVATLDNLGKGASGAAVQSLELMAGVA